MDPNLQIRGEGAVIQNLRLGWGSLKNIFSWPFGPQFGPNMRGGGAGPPGSCPGSTTVGGIVRGMVFM